MISKLLEVVDPAICAFAEWLSSTLIDEYNRTGKFHIAQFILTHIGAVMIVLGLAGYATNPSVLLFTFPLGLIWLGSILSTRTMPPWILLVAVAVICVSAVIAIPLAKNLPPTLLLAWLTIALVPLLFVRNPYIWIYFTPVWVIHAIICFWQWYVMDMPRVSGITGNANSAAALLLIGCVYLLNGAGRAKWVVVGLLVAMLFTGSRWTVGVTAVTLLTLFLVKHVSWKYIAVGMVVAVAITGVFHWEEMKAGWLRPNTIQEHLTGQGLTSTATETPQLSFIPQGFTNNGIHSVPWRMMHETGILSGVAWLLASGYGLLRYLRQRDSRWWMFLTVVLMALMYYHTWLGPLAPFWWLLVRPSKGKDGEI